MKVITNKKHEDTIDLEDVDLGKHFLVEKGDGVSYLYFRDLETGKIRHIMFDSENITLLQEKYKDLKDAHSDRLHAFNTLHEMLDFVKENTSE